MTSIVHDWGAMIVETTDTMGDSPDTTLQYQVPTEDVEARRTFVVQVDAATTACLIAGHRHRVNTTEEAFRNTK